MNAILYSFLIYLSPIILPLQRFLQTEQPQTTPGITEGLDWLTTFLSLMEKFGVALVTAVVFGYVIWGFLRSYKKAEIIPREMYDKVVAERDEYYKQFIEQLNINRQQNDNATKVTYEVLYPLRDTLGHLKKDSNAEENHTEGSG